MKSFSLILFLSVLCAWAQPALADNHVSNLGYTISVPEGWVVFNKEKAREKPEVVDAALDSARKTEGLSAWPERISTQVKEMVVGGKMDYYYSSDPRFTISVYKGAANIPQSLEKVREICEALPEEMSKETESKVRVHQCGLRTLDGNPALYLVADDYWKGRKYIQYQVQKAEDEALFFTASSRDKNFEKMVREFEDVMESVRVK